MSIEALFDHKCEIYHLTTTPTSKGYGLPNSNSYQYSDVPDLDDVPCHFKQLVDGTSVSTNHPNQNLSGDFILKLPIGTDVRINDKIVDKDTGLSYIAHVPPRSVRENHIKVKMRLDSNV